MTLLAPAALLLAVVAVPIVLLYVLRLRRPERTISSTLLWPHVVGDMQANAPWQRLRPSILLILQVLVVLGLVLALAQPVLSRRAVVTKDVIVILDQSFSMRARDAAPTRFATAQARARAIAAGLSSGSVMSVIGMSSQPHLAVAESSDQSAIDHAIDVLAPESAAPNTLAALSLAASLAREGERTEAIIFTDHSSGIKALPLSVPFTVTIERIGGVRRDLGIASIDVSGGKKTSAVVRVHNYGPAPATSDLDLFADGQLADVRTVSVPPGGEQAEIWDSLPAGVRVIRAHLALRDRMTADKTAWAVVPASQQRRVLLVTRGGYFLQTALSLQPGVVLQTVDPASYSLSKTRGADVVVFDGVLPHRLPGAPALLVGPPSGRVDGIRVGAERRINSVILASQSDPVMRYVDLSDVHVARARSVSLPIWMHVAARAGTLSLVAAGQLGDERLALISFPMSDSDWPLRVSFPIAMRNLLEYLAPSTVVTTPAVNTGSPVEIVPPSGTRTLQIVAPDGSTSTLRPPFPPFTVTQLAGVYRVETEPPSASGVLFAANNFSRQSPDAPGPDTIQVGRRSAGIGRVVPASVPIEWAFCALVVALLSVEWWVAFKR
jgi:hypothetical protein